MYIDKIKYLKMTLKFKNKITNCTFLHIKLQKNLDYLKILFCNEYLSDNDSKRYLNSAYFHTVYCPVVAKLLKMKSEA